MGSYHLTLVAELWTVIRSRNRAVAPMLLVTTEGRAVEVGKFWREEGTKYLYLEDAELSKSDV